jgi:hypothetical protein
MSELTTAIDALDDIEVDVDGMCAWADVADALAEIRRHASADAPQASRCDTPQRVYVVYGAYDYEDEYRSPTAAFATEKAAKEWVERNPATDRFVPTIEAFDLSDAPRSAASTVEPVPETQDERLVRITDYWRNDALEKAASISERYGSDPQIASDIRALKHAPTTSPEPDAVRVDDVRWGVNVLLETIAKQFEAWDTMDLWRSQAADLVRSHKHITKPEIEAATAAASRKERGTP